MRGVLAQIGGGLVRLEHWNRPMEFWEFRLRSVAKNGYIQKHLKGVRHRDELPDRGACNCVLMESMMFAIFLLQNGE